MTIGKESKNLLSPKTSQPLYLQTRDLVLRKILDKEYSPGEQLPNDRELSKLLNINHITLAKALNLLRKEGFLIRRQGLGTFVVDQLPTSQIQHCKRPTIALVLDKADEKFFMTDLFISIFNSLDSNDLSLNLFSSKSSAELQFEQMEQIIHDPNIAGCIIWSIMDGKQIKSLLEHRRPNFPIVFLDCYPDGNNIDWSGHDDYSAGWLMGNHMRKLGYQQAILVQLVTDAAKSTVQRRLAAFSDSFHGMEQSLVIDNKLPLETKIRQAELVLQHSIRPDGAPVVLFAISDTTACILDAALRKNPVQAEHFRLCYIKTQITLDTFRVEMDIKRMGSNAVEIIRQRLSGECDSRSISMEAPCILHS